MAHEDLQIWGIHQDQPGIPILTHALRPRHDAEGLDSLPSTELSPPPFFSLSLFLVPSFILNLAVNLTCMCLCTSGNAKRQ